MELEGNNSKKDKIKDNNNEHYTEGEDGSR